MNNRQFHIRNFLIGAFLLAITACATVGREFPAEPVLHIQTGKTTQEDIKHTFGLPWRTGLEDGLTTWTYGKYEYSLFRETSTQDLVVRFNKDGIVDSYTFNTTAP